jgi:hypothetical protein
LGHRIGPVTALLLLSPFAAEILSGAFFPLLPVIFPPFLFLYLGLWGCGAVLIREAVVRWGRGWPSILALGAAFAFLEEGLVFSSFTDPLSPARQALDPSGTWGAGPDGINWVWIATMVFFNAVVSIALPILLVQLAYPSRAGARWLSGRRVAEAIAWLAAAAALGRTMFSSGEFSKGYYAHIASWQVVATVAAIGALIVVARYLPARIGPRPRPGQAPSPVSLVIMTASAYCMYFLAGFGGKGLGYSPNLAFGLVVGVAIAAAVGFMFLSSLDGWSDRHRFAVAAGVGWFYAGLNLALGPFNFVVGAFTGYELWRGWRWIKAGQGSAVVPAPDEPAVETPAVETPLTEIARKHAPTPNLDEDLRQRRSRSGRR